MYCENCGKQINDGFAFCEFCGAPQTKGNTSPSVPPFAPTTSPESTESPFQTQSPAPGFQPEEPSFQPFASESSAPVFQPAPAEQPFQPFQPEPAEQPFSPYQPEPEVPAYKPEEPVFQPIQPEPEVPAYKPEEPVFQPIQPEPEVPACKPEEPVFQPIQPEPEVPAYKPEEPVFQPIQPEPEAPAYKSEEPAFRSTRSEFDEFSAPVTPLVSNSPKPSASFDLTSSPTGKKKSSRKSGKALIIIIGTVLLAAIIAVVVIFAVNSCQPSGSSSDNGGGQSAVVPTPDPNPAPTPTPTPQPTPSPTPAPDVDPKLLSTSERPDLQDFNWVDQNRTGGFWANATTIHNFDEYANNWKGIIIANGNKDLVNVRISGTPTNVTATLDYYMMYAPNGTTQDKSTYADTVYTGASNTDGQLLKLNGDGVLTIQNVCLYQQKEYAKGTIIFGNGTTAELWLVRP